ncbi:glycoside hydrolase family 43 protein [Thermothelomyces thermophilus ATCC 42464]|uniref:Glycoside hydrolase family 43 protein n=1 Tax=Thermothelomyces thermophilus (strain ATCC 42464 / BCRC 31852 / DSM 1799) TaxID=573729 RepID=G2QQ09_THET4|nr:glycoside hydrolase family 43 protein [Thermothelomyces thermophilus ATCC 42464]AEO61672.1 glycoside hydrolase family 43 protein [Thermothelomyces thermophilus ATCC 42464]
MLKSALPAALALLLTAANGHPSRTPAAAAAGGWAPLANGTFRNPILYEDFPDNDVSVGPDGAFYLSASNFHFSPGAPILRSYDLVDWEFVGHSIPRLDFGAGYDLPPTGERAYRAGTWASTLRYRESTGLWYWIGCTNFWRTWVFTAPAPEGPWTRAGDFGDGVCFYDNGLLVDDDDTMYVVYTHDGGKRVNVTQLSADGLSAVRTETVLVPEQAGVDALEGNRMYKIDGRYYILNDHPGTTAYVWKSDSPWGPYEGKALADNVASPLPGGGAPHQGSLVPTPSGAWYFMSFTWAYPSGRLPVLAPIDNYTLGGNGAAGLILRAATVAPDDDLYSARNTLTHRAHGPFPSATLVLDVADMADGDRAGLAAFRDRSAYIGIHCSSSSDEKKKKTYEVVARFNMTLDEWGSGETLDLGEVVERVELASGVTRVWLRASMDARPDGERTARFGYSVDGGETFAGLGPAYQLYAGWPFFVGYRFAVFNYATKALGGSVTVLSLETDSGEGERDAEQA